jgi:hypothetical protein
MSWGPASWNYFYKPKKTWEREVIRSNGWKMKSEEWAKLLKGDRILVYPDRGSDDEPRQLGLSRELSGFRLK